MQRGRREQSHGSNRSSMPNTSVSVWPKVQVTAHSQRSGSHRQTLEGNTEVVVVRFSWENHDVRFFRNNGSHISGCISCYYPTLRTSPLPRPHSVFTHQEVKPHSVLPLKPVDLQSGPYRIILVSGKGGCSRRIDQNLLARRLITAFPKKKKKFLKAEKLARGQHRPHCSQHYHSSREAWIFLFYFLPFGKEKKLFLDCYDPQTGFLWGTSERQIWARWSRVQFCCLLVNYSDTKTCFFLLWHANTWEAETVEKVVREVLSGCLIVTQQRASSCVSVSHRGRTRAITMTTPNPSDHRRAAAGAGMAWH